MTDPGLPGDLASLEPLEPLDTAGMAAPANVTDDAALQIMRSGLPAPAFNPFCRDKSLYKRLPEWVMGRPLSFREWFELRILQARSGAEAKGSSAAPRAAMLG